MKIYCNDPYYCGIRAGIPFVNGVGETTDKYLISWFRENGYKVDEDLLREATCPTKTDEELQLMDLDELIEYAKAIGKGKGVGVLKNREQALAHIKK